MIDRLRLRFSARSAKPSLAVSSAALAVWLGASALWPPVTSTVDAVRVGFGSSWRYLDDGSNQGTAWQLPGFDDSGWQEGPAQLGYGDGDESTVVSFGPSSSNKHITTYFRHTFEVVAPLPYPSLALELLRDDGAAVYLNGTEVFRSNLAAGPLTSSTTAQAGVGGSAESQSGAIRASARQPHLDRHQRRRRHRAHRAARQPPSRHDVLLLGWHVHDARVHG